jgi:hypothetical protein
MRKEGLKFADKQGGLERRGLWCILRIIRITFL